jgi:adenylate kinase family enzyme
MARSAGVTTAPEGRRSGPRVTLLGKQGAGKGTQARRLGAIYRVPQISTGDMFRAAAIAGTLFGLRVAEYMDRGELVPDDVVIAVIADRLAEEEATGGSVLDGFPARASRQRNSSEFSTRPTSTA